MSRHRLSVAALGAIALAGGAMPTMGRTTGLRKSPPKDEPRVPDYHGAKRLAKAEAKRERKKAARASTPSTLSEKQ